MSAAPVTASGRPGSAHRLAARRAPRPGLARLDAALGRVPMGTLVLGVLAAIGATAVVLAGTGALATDPVALLASAATALAATWLGTTVGARVTRSRPHPTSWAVTGLILFLLLWPGTTAAGLLTVAAAGLVAGLSKYVVAVRGRHLLNPAAAGAAALGLLALVVPGIATASWWVGSAALLPVVAVGALLVLWRTRRLGYAAAYAVPAWALTVLGYVLLGTSVADAAWWALSASPVVFLAGFMLSEPLTTPARRWQRTVVALVVAVLSVAPLYVDAPLTPELALVVGNVVAWVLSGRGPSTLLVTASERRGDLLDLRLVPTSPLRAVAGQYLEIDVPGAADDARGRRRALSIASDPASGEVRLLTRVDGGPAGPSAFKRALADLRPGDEVRSTGVWGDFVLPAGNGPLALVASGVGVTPFLAHLATARPLGRDVVLVHAVRDARELVLPPDVPGVSRVVAVVRAGAPGVGPAGPVLRDGRPLPAGWTWVDAALADPDALARAVPDLATRDVLASGPPGAVAAVRAAARRAGVRHLRTDVFLGT